MARYRPILGLRTRLKQVNFLYFMLSVFLLASVSTYFNYKFLKKGKTPALKYLQALDGIEIKIRKIEEDIIRNHETIKEIKDTVGKIAKGDRSGIDRLREVFRLDGLDRRKSDEPHGVRPNTNGVVRMEQQQPLEQKEEEKYEVQLKTHQDVSQEVCTWSDSPATADIQMYQVFETLPFDNPDGGVWKQGWPLTYSVNQWTPSKKLNVFVIPHSHCDPGWLKTFDDYYRTETKQIFESMVPKLEEDKRRKFIYAEISFFSHWWDEIDEAKKNRVKKLVENGQLEIVTGGWVMTDEANAHYYAMIDQLIEGHQWLEGTLGVKPESGWAIDPFGYSSTMAYILKRTGFKSMLIQRVHYSIKKHLAQRKAMEFMWRQQWDGEGSTDMFCHMMPFYSYDIPHTCGPDPQVCCTFDFMRLPGSKYRCPWKMNPMPITNANVAGRATTLLDQYRKKAQLYKTDVLLVPLGDDFRYSGPEEWDRQFVNYQTIFDYINSHPELNAQAQFGTLSNYFNALYKSTGVEAGAKPNDIPTLTGDFFTYADRDDHYWSGYFTSRPFYKHLDRLMEGHLRSAEIIYSMALSYARKFMTSAFPSVHLMKDIVDARRALGLFQHHDGITGTAKDFVVIDYGNRMVQALANLKRVMVESATYLLVAEKNDYNDKEHYFNVDEIRESHDSLPEKTVLELSPDYRSVILYNSLAQKRNEVVKVFVNNPDVEVKDTTGKVIHSQVEPFWTEKGSSAIDKFKLTFVSDIPAIGVARYQIRTVPKGTNPRHHYAAVELINALSVTVNVPKFKVTPANSQKPDFTLENSQLKAQFSGRTGLLKSMTTKSDMATHKMEVEFVLYGTKNAKDKSGAYLFLPDGEARPVPIVAPVIRVIQGPILSEVHVLTQHAEHIVRVINSPGTDGASLDIFNIVDVRHLMNKEVALRIHTDVHNSERVFYTDLNGFQMQRRKTYDKLPLQANVYPMPAMMFMEDINKRFTIASQQSLGVASLTEGVVEVILDRRLNQDDNRGLGQGVLDNKRTPNRFRLLLELRKAPKKLDAVTVGYPSLLAHVTSLHLTQPVYVMPQNPKAPKLKMNPVFTPISRELPCDLHLLNLRTLQNKDDNPELKYVPKDTTGLLLHRLAHDCSYPVHSLSCTASDTKVTFENMLKDLKITKLVETSLTMMFDQEELDPTSVIEVEPMEVAAYRVTIK